MGNRADFVWMLLVGAAMLLPLALLMGIPFMSYSLYFMLIYIWSKRNPEEQTSFWGFPFKAAYLPWVLMGFAFILGDDITRDLCGIAAGHIYYFVQELLPEVDMPILGKGRRLLLTPAWLYNAMGLPSTNAGDRIQRMAGRQPGGPAGGPAPAGPPAPRAFTGVGRVLGRD
jgi:hypothetical protein